ncbi:hypothetical protein THAOC_25131, partial [Thalassiosira oceanica]
VAAPRDCRPRRRCPPSRRSVARRRRRGPAGSAPPAGRATAAAAASHSRDRPAPQPRHTHVPPRPGRARGARSQDGRAAARPAGGRHVPRVEPPVGPRLPREAADPDPRQRSDRRRRELGTWERPVGGGRLHDRLLVHRTRPAARPPDAPRADGRVGPVEPEQRLGGRVRRPDRGRVRPRLRPDARAPGVDRGAARNFRGGSASRVLRADAVSGRGGEEVRQGEAGGSTGELRGEGHVVVDEEGKGTDRRQQRQVGGRKGEGRRREQQVLLLRRAAGHRADHVQAEGPPVEGRRQAEAAGAPAVVRRLGRPKGAVREGPRAPLVGRQAGSVRRERGRRGVPAEQPGQRPEQGPGHAELAVVRRAAKRKKRRADKPASSSSAARPVQQEQQSHGRVPKLLPALFPTETCGGRDIDPTFPRGRQPRLRARGELRHRAGGAGRAPRPERVPEGGRRERGPRPLRRVRRLRLGRAGRRRVGGQVRDVSPLLPPALPRGPRVVVVVVRTLRGMRAGLVRGRRGGHRPDRRRRDRRPDREGVRQVRGGGGSRDGLPDAERRAGDRREAHRLQLRLRLLGRGGHGRHTGLPEDRPPPHGLRDDHAEPDQRPVHPAGGSGGAGIYQRRDGGADHHEPAGVRPPPGPVGRRAGPPQRKSINGISSVEQGDPG